MKTNLKTFLEGKEKEFDNRFGFMNGDGLNQFTPVIKTFLSQTAKEAYELGKKEGYVERCREIINLEEMTLKTRKILGKSK